jgi:MFS family permease
VEAAGRRSGPFYGWYIVAALFFATFIAIGVRQGFQIFVETWEQDFGAKTSVVTAAAAIGWVLNGVSQPYFGRLTDRFGGRRVLILGMAFIGLAALGVAASRNPFMLIVMYGFLLSFASGAISFTPAGALLSRWFVRKRGTAMSILTTGGSLSGLLMIPFMAYMLDITSWQTVWLVLGAMILALGLPTLVFVLRSSPEEMGLEPDGEQSSGRQPGSGRRIIPVGPLNAESWRDSFRSFPMWQLLMTFAVCGVTTGSISVHFIRWASSEGISTGAAALAFGVLSVINGCGVLLIGRFSDRMQRKTLLGGVYLVRFVAFLSLIFLPGSWALWGFAIIGGMSWLATVPLTTSLTADVYGVKHIGVLGGLISMSHQLAAGAAVLAYGLIFDATGSYDIAFVSGAVFLLGAAIISLRIREKDVSSRYSPRVQGLQAAPAGAGNGEPE